MKSLILTSIAVLFLCGSATFAQQPTEWHPAIADDNKAATWDQTSAWLIGVLKTESVDSSNEGAWLRSPTEAKTSSKACALDITSTLVVAFTGNGRIEQLNQEAPLISTLQGTLEMSQVDPLSIRVVHDPNPAQNAWQVIMEGVNRNTIFDGTNITRNSWVEMPSLNDLLQHCENDKKGRPTCVTRPYSAFRYEVFISDFETAKRIARGFMHASLVCGGTKAVSPF